MNTFLQYLAESHLQIPDEWESARLIHKVEMHGLGHRLMIQSFLQDSEKTWLDVLDKPVVDLTIDYSTPDKPVRLNRIDVAKKGKGYAGETIMSSLVFFKKAGWHEAVGYIESANSNSQRMMVKLGGEKISDTDHGSTWRIVL